MKKVFLILSILYFVMPFTVKAEQLKLAESAKSAILIEASTGEIIFEKNSHEKREPASMTKMMSMLLILESIEKGIISWDEIVTVSENASSMGGSQILLETNEQMSVSDLFKGIAVASGNDAVVALAEKIAGTEEIFVDMMNKRAQELGLTDTNFKNCHGLHEANHYSSAYDMSIIARELAKHEVVFKYSSIYEDYLRENTDRKIWLVNTNKLVRFYDGVDGLKTGYTQEAGYCLTATAKKNGMRVIAVVMGEPDSGTRNKEVSEMLDYVFAQYEVEQVLSKDSILDKVKVSKGKEEYVEVVPMDEVTFLNKKIDPKKSATFDLQLNTVTAPIKVGEKIGTLKITEDGETRYIDVTVKNDVEKAGIFKMYFRNVKEILTGDIS
ncbi:MAG: D-alanyl-D-alanine carboxypeptidase [Clostridium sp.]|nr:D-alanyl-D-alanine carboxypeptidase [Clostridium sp.]MCM1444248.1 D-alanyl-D-alanine carboxypeptidase [Candidatus Amulumruptor caecigallinarius]